MPNLVILQSPDIRQNPDAGMSHFRISDQLVIKENCHNLRISDEIDMKFMDMKHGQVSKQNSI